MSNPSGLKKSRFSPKGPTTPKNLRCFHADYEYVKISSFSVLGIKLWLEVHGDLNRNDPLYSFKLIQLKAQN